MNIPSFEKLFTSREKLVKTIQSLCKKVNGLEQNSGGYDAVISMVQDYNQSTEEYDFELEILSGNFQSVFDKVLNNEFVNIKIVCRDTESMERNTYPIVIGTKAVESIDDEPAFIEITANDYYQEMYYEIEWSEVEIIIRESGELNS